MIAGKSDIFCLFKIHSAQSNLSFRFSVCIVRWLHQSEAVITLMTFNGNVNQFYMSSLLIIKQAFSWNSIKSGLFIGKVIFS